MRTIVEMPDALLEDLGDLAKREQISRAEVIRRAVIHYLRAFPTGDQDDEAFGMWSSRETSGTDYEDQVREEWQRREGPP